MVVQLLVNAGNEDLNVRMSLLNSGNAFRCADEVHQLDVLYAAALEAHDYRAQKFLGWFIDEQLEEEDNADTMITNMKLFGGDPKGLYDLDQACAARVYTVPSPLAGK